MNNLSKELQWNKLSNKMPKRKIKPKAKHKKTKISINKFLKASNYKNSIKEIKCLMF